MKDQFKFKNQKGSINVIFKSQKRNFKIKREQQRWKRSFDVKFAVSILKSKPYIELRNNWHSALHQSSKIFCFDASACFFSVKVTRQERFNASFRQAILVDKCFSINLLEFVAIDLYC